MLHVKKNNGITKRIDHYTSFSQDIVNIWPKTFCYLRTYSISVFKYKKNAILTKISTIKVENK